MTIPAFQRLQYEFAAHIRDPEHVAGPRGIEDRRIAVYRELFYNNVEGFISAGFPVLRSLYNDADWHPLIRDYFSNHKARTPRFPEMAQEFVGFLQNEFTPRECDPGFMLELAHYEWMETALVLAQDSIDDVSFNAGGDLANDMVVVSPLAWLLSYEWPVHSISAKYRPTTKPELPTRIIIYRDKRDEIGFMLANSATARLLQLLDNSENQITGRQALRQIAEELNHPQPEVVVSGGLDMLRQLHGKDIVLGTSEGEKNKAVTLAYSQSLEIKHNK